MNYPATDPEAIADAINSEIAGALGLEPQNLPEDIACYSDWFATNTAGEVYPPVETPADLRALTVEWLEACQASDDDDDAAGRALEVLDPGEVDIQAEQEQGYNAMIGRSIGGRP